MSCNGSSGTNTGQTRVYIFLRSKQVKKTTLKNKKVNTSALAKQALYNGDTFNFNDVFEKERDVSKRLLLNMVFKSYHIFIIYHQSISILLDCIFKMSIFCPIRINHLVMRQVINSYSFLFMNRL